LIGKVGTALISCPCGIKSAIMGKDIKGNHLEFMKDANQNMKDFIIETFSQAGTKVGESAFTGNMVHGNAHIGTVTPTPILIPEDIKEMTHILVTVDMPKKVEEEQAWRVITRRAVRGIAVCN